MPVYSPNAGARAMLARMANAFISQTMQYSPTAHSWQDSPANTASLQHALSEECNAELPPHRECYAAQVPTPAALVAAVLDACCQAAQHDNLAAWEAQQPPPDLDAALALLDAARLCLWVGGYWTRYKK